MTRRAARGRIGAGGWLPLLVLAIALWPTPAAAAEPAGTEPDPTAIHRLLVRVNDWQLAHPYQKPTRDADWIRGTWYTGVVAAYRATSDRRFLDQAMTWAKAKGFAVGYERAGANRLFPADTWCDLALITGDQSLVAKVVAELDTAKPNTPTGAPVWYLEGGRRYADSLFAIPVLAKLTAITGDRKYLVWMDAFYQDVAKEIWEPREQMFFRDARFLDQRTANGKRVVWSRGAGWVHSGLARLLEILPADDPLRDAYADRFKRLSATIAASQPEDGLWRPNLADPLQFPMPETSGTAFFCSGLAWGVRAGLLDRPTYEPVVRKAWAALAAQVSDEGKVRFGQTVGDRPAAVDREDSHEYVTGAFLLAGSAMIRLTAPGR